LDLIQNHLTNKSNRKESKMLLSKEEMRNRINLIIKMAKPDSEALDELHSQPLIASKCRACPTAAGRNGTCCCHCRNLTGLLEHDFQEEEWYDDYVAFLKDEYGFQDDNGDYEECNNWKNGFLGETGCKLPRALRSYNCQTYFCAWVCQDADDTGQRDFIFPIAERARNIRQTVKSVMGMLL